VQPHSQCQFHSLCLSPLTPCGMWGRAMSINDLVPSPWKPLARLWLCACSPSLSWLLNASTRSTHLRKPCLHL
jgi:hypothetical protein